MRRNERSGNIGSSPSARRRRSRTSWSRRWLRSSTKCRAGLGKAIEVAQEKRQKLARYGKVAWTKTVQLHQTMKRLLPQSRYWLKTGYVAANKVISLQIPELYSVVRGTAGRPAEFVVSWGVARL